MNSYQQKKDYKVSRESIDVILEKLKNTTYKHIHYLGYADKDLIISLKNKYKVSISDWFDRTNTCIGFWYEGEEEEGFPLPPVPDWMEGVASSIEGIPKHEVLILDLPLERKLYQSQYHYKPAEIVFLLGDADSSNFETSYTWSFEGVWIGRNSRLQREKDLFDEKINKAYDAITDAEAVIITAGAGMGVDSGLPDFRGNEGFWQAYPPIKKMGYNFAQMANPSLFSKNSKLAWGFYGHRLNLYRSTVPHKGFELLLDLVHQKNDNYFIYTSNVDGQFQKAGFDEDNIAEVHGSIHYLQCTENCTFDIWENNLPNIDIDMNTLEAKSLPQCKHCSQLSRPNILMFGDFYFLGDRVDEQIERFRQWRFANKEKETVIIEIGAGSAIPTIRNFGDQYSRGNENITLIRINPREFEVNDPKNIGIALGGLEGIEQICSENKT